MDSIRSGSVCAWLTAALMVSMAAGATAMAGLPLELEGRLWQGDPATVTVSLHVDDEAVASMPLGPSGDFAFALPAVEDAGLVWLSATGAMHHGQPMRWFSLLGTAGELRRQPLHPDLLPALELDAFSSAHFAMAAAAGFEPNQGADELRALQPALDPRRMLRLGVLFEQIANNGVPLPAGADDPYAAIADPDMAAMLEASVPDHQVRSAEREWIDNQRMPSHKGLRMVRPAAAGTIRTEDDGIGAIYLKRDTHWGQVEIFLPWPRLGLRAQEHSHWPYRRGSSFFLEQPAVYVDGVAFHCGNEQVELLAEHRWHELAMGVVHGVAGMSDHVVAQVWPEVDYGAIDAPPGCWPDALVAEERSLRGFVAYPEFDHGEPQWSEMASRLIVELPVPGYGETGAARPTQAARLEGLYRDSGTCSIESSGYATQCSYRWERRPGRPDVLIVTADEADAPWRSWEFALTRLRDLPEESDGPPGAGIGEWTVQTLAPGGTAWVRSSLAHAGWTWGEYHQWPGQHAWGWKESLDSAARVGSADAASRRALLWGAMSRDGYPGREYSLVRLPWGHWDIEGHVPFAPAVAVEDHVFMRSYRDAASGEWREDCLGEGGDCVLARIREWRPVSMLAPDPNEPGRRALLVVEERLWEGEAGMPPAPGRWRLKAYVDHGWHFPMH